MDHRELKKLVQLMNDNELVELEIEQEGLRVCLRKAGAVASRPCRRPPAYAPRRRRRSPPARPRRRGADGAAAAAGHEGDPVSRWSGPSTAAPARTPEPYVDVGRRRSTRRPSSASSRP